jgi:hypothetical protein
MNSVRGGKPGRPRSPSHLPLGHQRPLAQMLRVPQRLNAVHVSVSALDRRGRSADGLRAPPRKATRPPAKRQPLRWGSARFHDRDSPSAFAALRRRTSPPPAPTRRRTGFALAATFRRSGTPAPPPTTSRPTTPPASCRPPPRTGTRSGTSLVCGPSDVPVVPRCHGLLVRLLRQL